MFHTKLIAEQIIINDQLMKESLNERLLTSIAIKDLISYVESNQKKDVLAFGFNLINDNPYREKANCLII
jgi:hypothetical protein